MTKDEAIDFFAEFYGGEHHLPNGAKGIKPHGDGWCVNHYSSLATYDFNELTRLVFMAHDKCYRLSIMHSGPKMVKIAIWKRTKRGGRMPEMHPTLEAAVAEWRKRHKQPPDDGWEERVK